VGERPSNWIRKMPSTICDRCEMMIEGKQWTFRQHQQSKRRTKAQGAA
jgi:hypothetical protein